MLKSILLKISITNIYGIIINLKDGYSFSEDIPQMNNFRLFTVPLKLKILFSKWNFTK